MTDKPRVTVPAHSATYERLPATADVRPIGVQIINTAEGPVECLDGLGLGSLMLTQPDGYKRIALMVYDPEPVEGEAHGIALMHQLDAASARAFAGSLLRLADELEPIKPN
jgi:hypothetical protein